MRKLQNKKQKLIQKIMNSFKKGILQKLSKILKKILIKE
jgi:hypothetical protein